MRIAVPKKLTPYAVSDALDTLWNRVAEPTIEIDFSSVEFAYPFGSVALLVGLRGFMSLRDEKELETKLNVDVLNSSGCSYLQRFGFFSHLGVNQPVPAGELKLGNGRFMFIERITKDQFEFEGVPIQEKLDHFCVSLSKLILDTTEEDMPQIQAIAWSLREIIRNVFEHSGVDEAYITAQSWTGGFVELAIGDCGVGIETALSQAYQLRDGSHALEMAVLPGVTEYTGPETRNKWQNSGYGLYMMSEIAKEFGSFNLGSSKGYLSINSQDKSSKSSGFWTGTTVGMRLKIPADVYWTNLLARTKLRGEELSKSIKGARTRASGSSSTPWSRV
jgi:anti-sigma regulatory factor (Ser/Thr protein kinase)